MGNNRVKPLKVHAMRSCRATSPPRLETECGIIGRTQVNPGEWRTALGNPFKIGTSDEVTCAACRRWLKVKK